MSRSLFAAKVSIPVVLASALLLFLSGCGGGRPDVEPVKGKVVCNGQPVTVGSVAFVPIGAPGSEAGGRPAIGTVGPDGTFVLTTYETGDGAIVGKHRVEYVASDEHAEEEEQGEAPPEGSPAERARYAEQLRQRKAQQMSQYVLAAEMIVEVKDDGENDFTIEVSPAGMSRSPAGMNQGYEGVNRED